jgi:hypothetical protein
MKTMFLRVFGMSVLSLLIVGGVARGQSAAEKSPDLLTSKQLRELVATATAPADHLRLSRHFTALAAKYEADATEHRALAAVYHKAPTASETKRPMAPDTAAHCDRFATLAAQAATEARSLATVHERMAKAS